MRLHGSNQIADVGLFGGVDLDQRGADVPRCRNDYLSGLAVHAERLQQTRYAVGRSQFLKVEAVKNDIAPPRHQPLVMGRASANLEDVPETETVDAGSDQ